MTDHNRSDPSDDSENGQPGALQPRRWNPPFIASETPSHELTRWEHMRAYQEKYRYNEVFEQADTVVDGLVGLKRRINESGPHDPELEYDLLDILGTVKLGCQGRLRRYLNQY